MSVKFNFNASDFEQIERSNLLTTPYVGPATFRPQRSEFDSRVNPQDPSQVWDSVVFYFSLPGNRHYTESFYAPEDVEGATHTWKRILHILNHTVANPPTLETLLQLDDWDALRAFLKETYAEAEDREVVIKVVGDVYSGKAKLRFPYLGFVGEVGDVLAFSKKEVEANQKYEAFRNATPTQMGGGDGAPAAVPTPSRASF